MGGFKLIGKKSAARIEAAFNRLADSILILADAIKNQEGLKSDSPVGSTIATAVAEAAARAANETGETLGSTMGETLAVARPETPSEKPHQIESKTAETRPLPGTSPASAPQSQIPVAVAVDDGAVIRSPSLPQNMYEPELVTPGYFLNSFISSSGMKITGLYSLPRAGSILDRIASFIGGNHDDLKILLSLLKSSQSEGRQITFFLDRIPAPSRGVCIKFCEMLYAHAMLENYYHNRGNSTLIAKLSREPAVINFITGHWLEIYIFNQLESMLARYRQQYSCEMEAYGNIHISLSDGNNFEMDILCFINGQPLWIECKSGDFQNRITKYKNFGARYHIPLQNSFITVAGISEEQASSISQIHSFNICTLKSFRPVISKALDRLCMSISISTAPESGASRLDFLHFVRSHSMSVKELKSFAEELNLKETGGQQYTEELGALDSVGLVIGRNYIAAKQLLPVIRSSINSEDHYGTVSLMDKSQVENSAVCQIAGGLYKCGLLSQYMYKKVTRTVSFQSRPSADLISFVEGKWFYHCVSNLVNKFFRQNPDLNFSMARNVEFNTGDLKIGIDLVVKTEDHVTLIRTAFRDYEKSALEISALSSRLAGTPHRLYMICHDLTMEKIERITAQCGVCAINREKFESDLPWIFTSSDRRQHDAAETSSAAPEAVAPSQQSDAPAQTETQSKEEQIRFRIHSHEFALDELNVIFDQSGFAVRGFETYTKELSDSDGCANVISQNYGNLKSILDTMHKRALELKNGARKEDENISINTENLPVAMNSALCNLCMTFLRKGWLKYYAYKSKYIYVTAGDSDEFMKFIGRGWFDHRIYSETHKYVLAALRTNPEARLKIARNLSLTSDGGDTVLTVLLKHPGGCLFVKTALGNSEEEAEELLGIGRAVGAARDSLLLVTFGMDQVTARRISSIYGISVLTGGEYHGALEKLSLETASGNRSQTGAPTDAVGEAAPASGETPDGASDSDSGSRETVGDSASGVESRSAFAPLEEQFHRYMYNSAGFSIDIEPYQMELDDCCDVFNDDNFTVTAISSYRQVKFYLDKLVCDSDDDMEVSGTVLEYMSECLAAIRSGSKKFTADVLSISEKNGSLVYRLFAALQNLRYLSIYRQDEKTGRITIKISETAKLSRYLAGGWFAMLCSRMLEEHVAALADEYGNGSFLCHFVRNMQVRCNDKELTVDFVLKPQMGAAFFKFAVDDFEQAASELSTIRRQKNLVAENAILICYTDDGQLCEALGEQHQIQVIPFGEYQDYLNEYISIEPAQDEEEEESEQDEEDGASASPKDDLDDYEAMISKYGYCSDLKNIMRQDYR